MALPLEQQLAAIRKCRICADRFARTKTAHEPRPVIRARTGARILVAGQAPGMRVHQSGLPFDDPSGERLRDWMGLDRPAFYDETKVAIIPLAFCFPGYDAHGSDLPPPRICAETWRGDLMEALGDIPLILAVGQYAQHWHIGKMPMAKCVASWRDNAPRVFPLPHPSWRNTGWLKRNPWFETELLPALKRRVHEVLQDD